MKLFQIILGAIATVALNMGIATLLVFLSPFSGGVSNIIALLIGVFQLIYLLPIYFYLDREGQWDWIKGTVIGVFITILVNIWILWLAMYSDYIS
jgi:heme/copper-type cytochrome/quinol oxidase subunit 4